MLLTSTLASNTAKHDEEILIPRNTPDCHIFDWHFIFRAAEDQVLNLYPKQKRKAICGCMTPKIFLYQITVLEMCIIRALFFSILLETINSL